MPPRQAAPPTTSAPVSQPTAAADDLTTMLSQLGLPPDVVEQILAGGSGNTDPFAIFTSNFADPNMEVFSRHMAPRPPRVFGADIPDLTGTSIGPARRHEPTSRVFGADVPFFDIEESTKSVGDLLKSFYTFDRGRLLEVQRQLYAGGFMGDIDISDVNWGQHDESTFVAWAAAVTRAARYFAAGRKLTVDEVLASAASDRLGQQEDGSGGGGQQRVVSLSDPLALNQLLDSQAQSTLGRKATAQEQRMFVGIVHELQRSSQLAAQPVSRTSGDYDTDRSGDLSQAEVEAALAGGGDSGNQGGVVETTQPSPDAQAEAMLRSQHPVEAQAHDIDGQFRNFLQSLQGLV